MKNTWSWYELRVVIGVILIVVGAIFLLFFLKVEFGTFENHYLFLLGSGSISIIGFVLVRDWSFNLKIRKRKNPVTSIKKSGEKILVDLRKCKIKSHSYFVEVEKNDSYKVKALNAIYDETLNTEHIEINQCIIECKIIIDNKSLKIVSPVINKDEISLSFLLDNQKTTYVYFNKINKEYFFDLDFLYL
jgi:hypothetical protein